MQTITLFLLLSTVGGLSSAQAQPKAKADVTDRKVASDEVLYEFGSPRDAMRAVLMSQKLSELEVAMKKSRDYDRILLQKILLTKTIKGGNSGQYVFLLTYEGRAGTHFKQTDLEVRTDLGPVAGSGPLDDLLGVFIAEAKQL